MLVVSWFVVVSCLYQSVVFCGFMIYWPGLFKELGVYAAIRRALGMVMFMVVICPWRSVVFGKVCQSDQVGVDVVRRVPNRLCTAFAWP